MLGWLPIALAGCTNDFYAHVVEEIPPDAGGPECSGQCVPNAPLGWSEPVLVWSGDIQEGPGCPAHAPTIGYEGYAGFGATPLACPKCECEPPEGTTCVLPESWRASSALCYQPGTTVVFDAPPGWDGSCTTENAIAAGAVCNGSPCVRSLTIDPPVVSGGACAPKVDDAPPAKNDPFTTFARACIGNAYPPCESPGELCIPAAPEEFSTCIYQQGDLACPDPWSEKRVYHEKLIDNRGCTACACGPAEGGACTAALSAYQSNVCTTPAAALFLNSDQPPSCTDVMTGVALGSKKAEVLSIEPGACPPLGGEPIGDVEPGPPATFCCLPK